jgi:MscS family membrane protein
METTTTSEYLSFAGEYAWIIKVLIILAATVILGFLERIIFKHLMPKVKRTGKMWDAAFFKTFYRPLAAFIWVVGITLAIRETAIALDQHMIAHVIDPIRKLLIIGITVWFLNNFIKEIETRYLRVKGKENIDRTMIKGVGLLVRIIVFSIAILILLQMIFKVPLSGILAFGGLGGAVIGFAAKDLFANFFGGLEIFLDRPFVIGDWIRSPDREIEGHVEDIGWRLTKILTLDRRPLYVPNAIFSVIAIENPSRMLNRRIKTDIGIRYHDVHKLPGLLKDIETMVRNHPEVDTSQMIVVNFANFGESSLDIHLLLFTKAVEYDEFHKAQEDILFKIVELLDKHGARLAYPTTTIHIPEEKNFPPEFFERPSKT